MPTIENAFSGATITITAVPEAEKIRRAIDHFKRERPDTAEWIEKITFWAHSSTEITEILEVFDVVTESVGEGASLLGAFIFPIHATQDILDSWKAGERAIGLRARAYGVTAWAFDDPPPPIPQYLLRSGISQAAVQQALKTGMSQAYVKQAASELQSDAIRHQQVWKECSENAVTDLNRMVLAKNLDKWGCQVILRSRGNNDRNTLALRIMTEMAEKLSAIERSAFWQPSPQYPNS
jgi:hypothetical protein